MRGARGLAEGFDRFWAIWPKKVGKQEALRAWCSLAPSPELVATMLEAVLRITADPARWHKDGRDWQVLPDPVRWLRGRRWEDEPPAEAGYGAEALEVMTAYNAILGEAGWPMAVATPFSPPRAAAVASFLGFSAKPGWVEAYFAWLRDNLQPREGLGFDWAVSRDAYLRAREGNFASLRETA